MVPDLQLGQTHNDLPGKNANPDKPENFTRDLVKAVPNAVQVLNKSGFRAFI